VGLAHLHHIDQTHRPPWVSSRDLGGGSFLRFVNRMADQAAGYGAYARANESSRPRMPGCATNQGTGAGADESACPGACLGVVHRTAAAHG